MSGSPSASAIRASSGCTIVTTQRGRALEGEAVHQQRERNGPRQRVRDAATDERQARRRQREPDPHPAPGGRQRRRRDDGRRHWCIAAPPQPRFLRPRARGRPRRRVRDGGLERATCAETTNMSTPRALRDVATRKTAARDEPGGGGGVSAAGGERGATGARRAAQRRRGEAKGTVAPPEASKTAPPHTDRAPRQAEERARHRLRAHALGAVTSSSDMPPVITPADAPPGQRAPPAARGSRASAPARSARAAEQCPRGITCGSPDAPERAEEHLVQSFWQEEAGAQRVVR